MSAMKLRIDDPPVCRLHGSAAVHTPNVSHCGLMVPDPTHLPPRQAGATEAFVVTCGRLGGNRSRVGSDVAYRMSSHFDLGSKAVALPRRGSPDCCAHKGRNQQSGWQ